MRIGRNQPCPCGSGKKYKHCHADHPQDLPATPATAVESRSWDSRLPDKQRQCGPCKACCGPSLQINSPDLVKPTGEACRHLCEMGCSLWNTPKMPQLCRTYTCNYLVEPVPLTATERPDKLGAIVQRRRENETRLIECGTGGLARAMKNRFWGPLVLSDLQAGKTILVKFLGDTYGAETLRVKWFDGRLRCELASCHEDGAPQLVTVQPVHDREIQAACFYENQNFPFDAEVLGKYLRDRDAAVLTPSQTDGDAPQVRFRVTRRQIDVLNLLRAPLWNARPLMAHAR